MARQRATLLLRSIPAPSYPPCDMRRYVEMAVGRPRKDMSKARRVNPSMGVGNAMRNYIVDDYNSFLSFDADLRQRSSFPIEAVYSSGPTSIHDAALFLWRHHIYSTLVHQYIPANTPHLDDRSIDFIEWMNGYCLGRDTRWMIGVNHALDIVTYDGVSYKRKADHLISHYFLPREYLADANLLDLAGWDMSQYRPPAPDPAPDDEAEMRDAEYDDDHEDED